MKSFKKTSPALFALLAIISILPGCGKGKGGDEALYGVGVAATNVALNGQCYNFYSLGYGQPAILTFQGQASISGGGFLQGYAQGAAVGFPGPTHSRTNVAGDSVLVHFNGSTVYTQVTLHPNTVDYFRATGEQICGLGFNTQIAGNSLVQSVFVHNGQGWSYITL